MLINSDTDELSTAELQDLIVKLCFERNKRIDAMAPEDSYRLVKNVVAAAFVNEDGHLLSYTAASGIESCLEKSQGNFGQATVNMFENGGVVAQCYLVPIRLYTLEELTPFIENLKTTRN